MLPFESRDAMEKFLLESLDDLSILIRTLDHPQRMKIVALLVSGPKSFQELVKATQLQKSALGNHLNILVGKNLLEKIDRGFYSLSEDGKSIMDRITQGYLEIKVREKERMEKTRNLIERYTTQGEENMDKDEIQIRKMNVRIVELEPMTVASVQVFSKNPEEEGWEKISRWGTAIGLLGDLQNHPIFGFDLPINTQSEKEVRGFEYWIKADVNTKSEENILVKYFKGGLYAVTECKIKGNAWAIIPKTWQNLFKWVNLKRYIVGNHQPLENFLTPLTNPEDFLLDLYCPIKK